MNAQIFGLSFVVLVLLTLIFPSAENKAPIAVPAKTAVCAYVCARAYVRACKKFKFWSTKFNESPFLFSRITCG